MKRFSALLLALVMCMGMTVSAFAADSDTSTPQGSVDPGYTAEERQNAKSPAELQEILSHVGRSITRTPPHPGKDHKWETKTERFRDYCPFSSSEEHLYYMNYKMCRFDNCYYVPADYDYFGYTCGVCIGY